MEFHQIRYFLAACDHMNFTRAAEACAVSQPALTVAIKKLEEELGGPLFLRETAGVRLTDFGRAMRTHLARIDETRRAASRAAQEALDCGREEVNFGLYSTLGPGRLAHALTAFRAAEPTVRLVLYDVWGPQAYELLLSGAFDCAIVARHGPLPDRITAHQLYVEPMVLAVAASHRLAAGPVRAADLNGVVYFDRLRCEFREEIQAALMAQGISMETTLRSEAEDWVQAAVAQGTGVTILPQDQVLLPGIVTKPVEDLPFSRVIELVRVAARDLSPATQRLVRFIEAFDWSTQPPHRAIGGAAQEG